MDSADWPGRVDRVAALTGAGISTDSGVPESESGRCSHAAGID